MADTISMRSRWEKFDFPGSVITGENYEQNGRDDEERDVQVTATMQQMIRIYLHQIRTYLSVRMRNLTVDDVLWQLDESEFDFPGSVDANSAGENYEPIENGRDDEERDVQVTATMIIHSKLSAEQ